MVQEFMWLKASYCTSSAESETIPAKTLPDDILGLHLQKLVLWIFHYATRKLTHSSLTPTGLCAMPWRVLWPHQASVLSISVVSTAIAQTNLLPKLSWMTISSNVYRQTSSLTMGHFKYLCEHGSHRHNILSPNLMDNYGSMKLLSPVSSTSFHQVTFYLVKFPTNTFNSSTLTRTSPEWR